MSAPDHEPFIRALNALAEPAKRFFIYDAQFVPDIILYHLVLDVLEQGRAVSHLVAEGVGRPAWANTRAAFEAARDMLVLVAVPDEYCLMGARARVYEVLDTHQLLERRAKADGMLRIENQATDPKLPEEIVAAEAERWDEFAPGRGSLMRDAIGPISNQPLSAHWSGFKNREIRHRIANSAGDSAGVPEMMDALYGIQSIHAHPGSRTSLRNTSLKPDGTLFVEPREVDLQAPLAFMAMTAQLALIAFERRPVPESPPVS